MGFDVFFNFNDGASADSNTFTHECIFIIQTVDAKKHKTLTIYIYIIYS